MTSTNGHSSSQASTSRLPPVEDLARVISKRARVIFSEPNPAEVYAEPSKARLSSKIADEYAHAKELPPALLAQQGAVGPARPGGKKRKGPEAPETSGTAEGQIISDLHQGAAQGPRPSVSDGVVAIRRSEGYASTEGSTLSTALIRKKEAAARVIRPKHHPQWKLMRVISGHLGWVRSMAVEPDNKWFATGAGDRMIKASAAAEYMGHSRLTQLLPDLGSRFGRAQIESDRTHFHCTRSRGQ